MFLLNDFYLQKMCVTSNPECTFEAIQKCASFRFIAVGATCATATACVILFINILYDNKDTPGAAVHDQITFKTFSVAFGTICFGFGGHPAFPTFQADMRRQKDFGWAVFIGYLSKYSFLYVIDVAAVVVVLLLLLLLTAISTSRYAGVVAVVVVATDGVFVSLLLMGVFVLLLLMGVFVLLLLMIFFVLCVVVIVV